MDKRRLSVGMAALLLSATSALSEVEILETPLDDLVGWYEFEGAHVRATWRPAGGLYLLALDPEYTAENGVDIWVLESDGADGLRTEGGPVVVTREDGRVQSLGVPDDDGGVDLAVRLEIEPYAQRQVAWTNEQDGVRLVGTVFLPNDVENPPGAVIIQGAGTSGRSNIWAWTFGDGIARRGVAALVPDKRGSDMSAGDWMTSDFDVLATDAAGSHEALQKASGIAPDRIGFVGLSQGGWVAPLAAERVGAPYSASLVTAFMSPAEQLLHELGQDFREMQLSARETDSARRVLTLLLDYLKTGAGWERYIEDLDALPADVSASTDSMFPREQSAPTLGFFEGIAGYEYVAAVRRVRAPQLFLYGALDEVDNTPVGLSMARIGDEVRANPGWDAQIVVYPGLGHALAGQDTRWVSPRVLDDLAGWIRKAAESKSE